jgi:hypothetical protein
MIGAVVLRMLTPTGIWAFGLIASPIIALVAVIVVPLIQLHIAKATADQGFYESYA